MYHERVCVIQISTPEADYVVDTLALSDVSPIGAVFSDESKEKVLHGADYDVSTLRRDYGFEFVNIFDTMIASRVLGIKRLGLSDLLNDRFGLRLDKRMQRHNWGRRPFRAEELEYARLDTHYLLPLRDQLLDELRRRGREREAREAFRRVACSTWHKKPFDAEDFWRVKGAFAISDEERGILKALYALRDDQARQLDQPPFRVMSDQTMVEVCRRRPRTFRDLRATPGLSGQQIRVIGDLILRAVRAGLRNPHSMKKSPQD